MSWLSGLAGRAEDLLNKIDENAAQALKDPLLNRSSPLKRRDAVKGIPQVQKENCPDQHKLIDSLQAKSAMHVQKITLPFNTQNESKQKSVNPMRTLISKPPTHTDGLNKTAASIAGTSDANHKMFNDEHICIEENDPSFDFIGAEGTPETQKDKIIKGIKDPDKEGILKSLKNENKMLQNELCITNDQVTLLVQKAKNIEKLNEELQNKIYDLEKNYNEAMKEKDFILIELENSKKITHGMQISTNPDLHKLESSVKQFKEENYNLLEKIKELEDSNNKLEMIVMSTTTLKDKLENELRASQNFCIDLESQLAQSKDDIIKLDQDLEAYKIRAKGLLTMKETIIEEMQNSDMNDGTKIFLSQIEQLKAERDDLMQTVSNLTTEHEVIRRSARQAETQRSAAEKSNTALRDAVHQERAARENAEHALSSLTRELKSTRIETLQQLAVLEAQLRDRDSELQRFQMLQAASYTAEAVCDADTSPDTHNVEISNEIENNGKLHRLTEALVAKQAALDSMMADRNALRLQLEKTENKYRSDLIAAQSNRLTSRVINLQDNVTDDVKAFSRSGLRRGQGTFISNTFHDASFAFWTTSVKIGVFLRRNPMMRIMIIGYMALLHLWVLIVIMTYSPEVHPV